MIESVRNELNICLDILRKGGIILYPTDTIWGIGCDATNEKAVASIFNLKKRADSKSMIVLLDQTARLAAYIADPPQQAYELMELSEQPLTLVLDGAKNVAKNLVAEDGSLGVRIVKDEFCAALVAKLGKPIVSTSANISGEPSPSCFADISSQISSGVDYVVGLRRNETHGAKPSTIIRMGRSGEFRFLRK